MEPNLKKDVYIDTIVIVSLVLYNILYSLDQEDIIYYYRYMILIISRKLKNITSIIL